MKRLFCLLLGIAALLFVGACSSDTPPAGSEARSNNGNVDRIDFKEITMNGCDGANAIVGLRLTSIGTGHASAKVYYPTSVEYNAPSPGAILADQRFEIVANETYVELPIDAEKYAGGIVKLDVTADNYLVEPGEKGFQGAFQTREIPDVSNENCRLNDSGPEWWHFVIVGSLITVAAVLFYNAFRVRPKKRAVA